MPRRSIPFLAAGVMTLAACEATMTGNRDNTPAESACVAAVNANSGASGAMVMASQTSGTGTRVMVLGGDSQTWTCDATSAGVVEDLAVS